MAATEAGAGAADKSSGNGEFLRQWEANSTLSQKQQDLCLEIEASLATDHFQASPFAIFRHQTSGTNSGSNTTEESKAAADKQAANAFDPLVKEQITNFGDPLDAFKRVKTAEDFRSWYEEIERHLDIANEEKYHSLIEGLRKGRSVCEQIQKVLEGAQDELMSVKTCRGRVADTTGRFRSACENLVSERKRHIELADTLRRRLTYFEELETLSVKFGGGKDSISPTSPDFVKLLHRLDECIAYASSSTGAVAEADGYLARFLELQRKAFTMIKDHTVSVLTTTTQQAVKEINAEGAGRVLRESDLTDASKEYLRFRTIAPKIKLLMAELHSRTREKNEAARVSGESRFAGMPSGVNLLTNPLFSTRNFAINLLGDCEECFMEQRRRLLESSVQSHLKSLAETKTVVDFARLGSSYILQLCQAESQLYEHFFCPDTDQESLALTALLNMFCNILYEEIRSRALHENDLDTLVYLIETLRSEVLGTEAPRRGMSGGSFSNAATRCIADAQERIIYRAQVYIRDEIRNFVPSPSELDYPQIILRENCTTSDDEARKKSGQARIMYSTWYPPVERTLRLLSMLYRCVGGQVFAGIAQEAVAMCVDCLRSASNRIRESGKDAAEDHGELFLIWHLLMLREQTSPFDVDFAYTDKELDFKDLRNLLGDVIRGQASVRTLATPPAAMRERVVDSKQELERGVFTACEAYVLRMTRVSDPILSFLAKCNALPVNSGRGVYPPLSPSDAGLDRKKFETMKQTEGSFLHSASVRGMWENMERAIDAEFTEKVKRMKIYITKPSSCAILLRPVRANLSEAYNELLTTLQTRYTLEEREEIGIDGAKVESLMKTIDEIMGIPSLSQTTPSPTPTSK